MTRYIPSEFKLFCLSAISVMALNASVDAASLLDIDDLERVGGTSPNTFVTGTENTFPTTATKGASPTSMTFVANNGILLAYFDPITLTNVGDSITFSFTANFSNVNNASRGFRVGLFDHGTATKLTADVATTSFSNYKGYGLNTRATGVTTSNNEIYRRDPAQIGLFASTSSPSIKNTNVNSLNIVNGNSYSGSFSLQLTAVDTILVTWKFGSEADQTFSDSVSGIVKTFDTVALFSSNTLSPAGPAQIVFTEFNVDHVTAIPEPSFVFAVAGALGLLIWRRRR